MPRRYLVTGGGGFVSAALVRTLLGRGDSVTVLDTGEAAGMSSLNGLADGLRVIIGDIRDSRHVRDAINGCEAIVHLAAQASVSRSIEVPTGDMDVNVSGSLALLEAARRHGVHRFVFASSNAVVGGHPPPAHEGLVPDPVSPYGAAKAAVEACLRAYGHAYDLEGVSLRFANAYGPWSAHKTSVVAGFVKAYLAGGPLIIRGTGEQTRDFVHVDDVSRMTLACLDAPAETVAGETFQVGSGRETSLRQLAKVLFEVGGGGVPIEHRPPSAGDVARNFSDISKARRVLGWTPRISLRDGIADTLDWFRGRGRD